MNSSERCLRYDVELKISNLCNPVKDILLLMYKKFLNALGQVRDV